MKKKIIALLCVAALCAGVLSGCGKKAEEPAPEKTPAVEQETAAPEAPAETIPEDTGIPEPEKTDETKSFELSLEGQTETVEMTKYVLDMQHDGISVEIFIDDALFKCVYFEGEYSIVPIDSGENWNNLAHVYYISGQSADALAEDALNQAREGVEATDEGMVKLGDYDAYAVSFKNTTDNSIGCVYYITGDSGTVSAAFNVNPDDSGFLEGMLPRFEAMLKTIFIIKA